MKKIMRKVLVIGSLILVSFSPAINAQELKDIDGNTYKTIKHGLQVWTAGNLNVAHFSNGDEIPQASTKEEWEKATAAGQPAWCHYENDPVNGSKYGKLYNWYAINDPRGLAPKGFHIPTNDDWRLLIKNLLGIDMAGLRMKSKTGWKTATGKNDIGFDAMPAGFRTPDGSFKELGLSCRMWSNSAPVEVKPTGQIYSLVIEDKNVGIKYVKAEKGSGFSVRCEKD